MVMNNLYKCLDDLRGAYAAVQMKNSELECELQSLSTDEEDDDSVLIEMLNEYNNM